MADSNITKRALAAAMKKLMASEPFSKISVGDICEKCDMNRKSFYYHFKDKYDLINWIFNSEFIIGLQNRLYDNEWDIIRDICTYFYENRDFYRKALQIEGQNSFYEYFREILKIAINEYMKEMFMECVDSDFYVTFYTDAFVTSIVRWLTSRDCMSADEYVVLLKSCIVDLAKVVVDKLSYEEKEKK